MSPSPIDISANLKYEKKVEHVFRIETDKFKVCEGKTEKKKKWYFFEQLFVIHVKRNGTIDWEELK